MSLSFSGNGVIAGLAVGGLPDGVVDEDTLANNAVGSGKLASGVGGKILQVVSVEKTDTFSTTNTSFVDVTGLSLAITPSSLSNKIIVTTTASISCATSINGAWIRLLRDSTVIFVGDASGANVQALRHARVTATDELYPYGGSMVDSPNTLSQINYKIQLRSHIGNASTLNQTGLGSGECRTASGIIAMEISV